VKDQELTDQEQKDQELRLLLRWVLRVARRFAVVGGVLHYEDELVSIARSALARAYSAHDPGKGSFKPFATQWVVGELQGAIEDERRHMKHEGHSEDVEPLHPALRAEALAGDTIDALLYLYVGEDLRTNGEAAFLKEEAYAALREEVARLPPNDRRLVELRYWEGLTWAEVGVDLGMADRTAREHDARIREQLQDMLLAWRRVVPFRRKP
jgi:RNA polymerase sigma factor (sigma-70 family)